MRRTGRGRRRRTRRKMRRRSRTAGPRSEAHQETDRSKRTVLEIFDFCFFVSYFMFIRVARAVIRVARPVSQIKTRAETENNKFEDVWRCANFVHLGRSVLRCRFVYIL